jgi:hypothetical protein
MAEYQLSKDILNCWLKSPAISEELKVWRITVLQDYILTCVIPHESKFLYVRRLRIRAFDERTTSNAEAENSTMN